MADCFPPPLFCIRNRRFTKQCDWHLFNLSLSSSGNIALSGSNENTDRTSVDIYSINQFDSREIPKPFYSKQFEKHEDEKWIYWRRLISFVNSDCNSIINCVGKTLEKIQVRKYEVLQSRKISGVASCLSVRKSEIFIGFFQSNKISVYDVMFLHKIKSIILKGIQHGCYPYDMTVTSDRIFVSEVYPNETKPQRVLILEENDGKILSELAKPTDTHCYAFSITVSELLDVAAVVWFDMYYDLHAGSDKIVLYSPLVEQQPIVRIVEVQTEFLRITLSDQCHKVVTGNEKTGEVKVYDLADILLPFAQLKKKVSAHLPKHDYVELANFSKDKADTSIGSDTATEELLPALEEKSAVKSFSSDKLSEARSDLKISSFDFDATHIYPKTRTVLFQEPLAETEAIITREGATVTIPGTQVVLSIPSGAIPEHMEECVIKMRIIPRTLFQDLKITFSSNSSLVVEILPNNLPLKHPAKLMIPHCLLLRENTTRTAHIYMSHHEEGCLPCWVEHSDLEYSVERKHCVVWLKTFCWVTIKVDDKDVLAKHLILYSCAEKPKSTDEYSRTAVGYYPDLDGERKFLTLNKSMIVSERNPFVFMKEGSHPLCVVLVKYSSRWELWSPEKEMKIAFEDISSSFEHTCKFVFHKIDECAKGLMCLFRAFQENGQQAVTLTVCPEMLDLDPELVSQTCNVPAQKKEPSPAESISDKKTRSNEDPSPNQSKETSGSLAKQAEENSLYNKKLEESQQETLFQGASNIGCEAPDASMRPKINGQRKQDEERSYNASRTLSLYQPRKAGQNGNGLQRQLAPCDDYELSPHMGVGPLWPPHPFPQQNYFNYYHHQQIFPYSPGIGTACSLPDEDTPGQVGVGLGYGVIKAISRKLDTKDPLGNDWRQLADELGFTLEDISTFESAWSSTFAVIDCAMKRNKIKSPNQLKETLIKIGRPDAASVIKMKE